MDINSINSVQPFLGVLRNTAKQLTSRTKKKDAKALVPELAPNQIPNDSRIPAGFIPENATIIDLDELIQDLKDIATCRAESVFGFHGTNKPERDRVIGNAAKGLNEILVEEYKNPNPGTIISAYIFVQVYNFITTLEEISKQRGSNFGFGSLLLEEDILLAKKAEKFIEALVKTPNAASIEKTKRFLDSYELICALEEVAKRKLNNSSFGFAEQQIQKDDIEIGNKALNYAKAIKLKDNKSTINAAIVFLELLQEEESLKENIRPSIATEELEPVFS